MNINRNNIKMNRENESVSCEKMSRETKKRSSRMGVFALLVAMLVCLFCACSKEHTGTYYPKMKEMRKNLNANGYACTNVTDKTENGTEIYLLGTKGEEFIECYWLDSADRAETIAEQMKERNEHYDRFICMENDQKFGTIVVCATEEAFETSGIQIVEVKVK